MPEPPHRKRARKFDIAGHAHFLTFSCYQRLPLLTNDAWRTMLATSIRTACDKYRIALWPYVFIPEHVHLLLKPRCESYRLASFEQSMKTSSAMSILNALKQEKSPLLEKLIVQERPGRWIYRFWQEGGGHDLNIWTMKKAIEKAEYCHNNPVKRRLVPSADRWRWSSFRWLVQGMREGEPLRVDDWSEMLEGEPVDAERAHRDRH